MPINLGKQKVIAIEVIDNREFESHASVDDAPLDKTPFSFHYFLNPEEELDALTQKKIALALKKLNLQIQAPAIIKILAGITSNNTYNFLIKQNGNINFHFGVPIPPDNYAFDKIDLKTTVGINSETDVIDIDLIRAALSNKVLAAKLDKDDKTSKAQSPISVNLNVTENIAEVDHAILPFFADINKCFNDLAQQNELIKAIDARSEEIHEAIERTKKISAGTIPQCNKFNSKHLSFIRSIELKRADLKEAQKTTLEMINTTFQLYLDSLQKSPNIFANTQQNLTLALQLSALTYYRELLVNPITPEVRTQFNRQFENIAQITLSRKNDNPTLIFNASLSASNHSQLSAHTNKVLAQFHQNSSSSFIAWGFSRPRALFDRFLKLLDTTYFKLVDREFEWSWGKLTSAISTPELINAENKFTAFKPSATALIKDLQTISKGLMELLNDITEFANDAKAKKNKLEKLRAQINENVLTANTIVRSLEINYMGIDKSIAALQQALAALVEAANTINGQYAQPGNLLINAKTTLLNLEQEQKDSLQQGKTKEVETFAEKIKNQLTELTATQQMYQSFNQSIATATQLATKIDREITAQNNAASKDDKIINLAKKIASLFDLDDLVYWEKQVRWKGGTKLTTELGTFTLPLSVLQIFTAQKKLNAPMQIAEAKEFLEQVKVVAEEAELRGSHRMGFFRVRTEPVSSLQALIRDIDLDQSNLGLISVEQIDRRLDGIKPDWRHKFVKKVQVFSRVDANEMLDISDTIEPASLSLSLSSNASSTNTSPSVSKNDATATTNTSISRSRP